jgi:hypothetical protein
MNRIGTSTLSSSSYERCLLNKKRGERIKKKKEEVQKIRALAFHDKEMMMCPDTKLAVLGP